MRAPRGSLRALHNRTNNVAKVAVIVPPGGTVEVQDDVAAQLLASGDFAEGPAPAGLLDAVDEAHFVRFPDERPVVAEVAGEEPAPGIKRARRPKS